MKLPEKVISILTEFNEVDTYQKCQTISDNLDKIGWSIDYDLGCSLFDLKDEKGNIFNLEDC